MTQPAGCTASDGGPIAVGSQEEVARISTMSISQGHTDLLPQVVQSRLETSKANRDVPYEILNPIFRMTQPLPHEYSPSIALGPRNPWMVGLRTKKALTLVCKAWSGPATAFLYEDVVLRRMGQVCAFANMLLHSNSDRNITRLVRSIRLEDCIVLRHCADTVRRSLGHILRQCSALESFTYHPTSRSLWPFDVDRNPGDSDPSEFNIDPRWLLGFDRPNLGPTLADRLQNGLHTLEMDLSDIRNERWFIGPLYAMLGNASHLTSLVLSSFELRWHRDEWLLNAPVLKLPALEALHIHPQNMLFCDWMSRGWEMPQLKSLTYRSEIDPVEFLEAHGSKLTYAFLECGSHTLSELSRLVPMIEHLTLPLFCGLEELAIDSPTLRYLDIMREGYPTFSSYKSVSFASHARVPALKRVRLLGYGMWDIAARYPRVFDHELVPIDVNGPESLQARQEAHGAEQRHAHKNTWDDWVSGGVVHRVHGDVFRQKWWGVAHDPSWCPEYVFLGYEYGLAADVDLDEDGSYGNSESSSDSDSDASGETASDHSEDTESSGSPVDNMQLDMEAVLRMFRVGLEGDFMVVDEPEAEDSGSDE